MNVTAEYKRLIRFRNTLQSIGFDDETIAEAIRLGGHLVPIFSTQMDGFYVREDGRRDGHYAVPGWYEIAVNNHGYVVLSKGDGEEFWGSRTDLLAVLGANLEYVAQGMEP